MALTTGAFLTSRGVTDSALEKRAAQDLTGGGELGRELISFADGLMSCHR
jgi:hypothetical protein